jgi:hypothetical protein
MMDAAFRIASPRPLRETHVPSPDSAIPGVVGIEALPVSSNRCFSAWKEMETPKLVLTGRFSQQPDHPWVMSTLANLLMAPMPCRTQFP